jgi:hypothetical protein
MSEQTDLIDRIQHDENQMRLEDLPWCFFHQAIRTFSKLVQEFVHRVRQHKGQRIKNGNYYLHIDGPFYVREQDDHRDVPIAEDESGWVIFVEYKSRGGEYLQGHDPEQLIKRGMEYLDRAIEEEKQEDGNKKTVERWAKIYEQEHGVIVFEPNGFQGWDEKVTEQQFRNGLHLSDTEGWVDYS